MSAGKMKHIKTLSPNPSYHSEYIAQSAKTGLSLLGLIVGMTLIVLASVSFLTEMQLPDIMRWIDLHFGKTFSVLFAALVICSGYAVMMVYKQNRTHYFFQIGIQAANAISTLALTFTLLGISLGIGTLADQSLTPENVNQLISVLTKQFSMAFMTTVIGLPSALIVRATLAILVSKQQLMTSET